MVFFSRDCESCLGIGLAMPIHRSETPAWLSAECTDRHLTIVSAQPPSLHPSCLVPAGRALSIVLPGSLPPACWSGCYYAGCCGGSDHHHPGHPFQPFTPPNFSLTSSSFVRAIGWDCRALRSLGSFVSNSPPNPLPSCDMALPLSVPQTNHPASAQESTSRRRRQTID